MIERAASHLTVGRRPSRPIPILVTLLPARKGLGRERPISFIRPAALRPPSSGLERRGRKVSATEETKRVPALRPVTARPTPFRMAIAALRQTVSTLQQALLVKCTVLLIISVTLASLIGAKTRPLPSRSKVALNADRPIA